MFTLHHNEEENAHEEEDKVSKATWTSGMGAGRSVQPWTPNWFDFIGSSEFNYSAALAYS